MGFNLVKSLQKRAGGAIDAGGDFLSGGRKLGSDIVKSDTVKSIGKGIGSAGSFTGGYLKANSPSALINTTGQALGGLGQSLGLDKLTGGLGGLFKNPMTIILIVVALVVVLMVMK